MAIQDEYGSVLVTVFCDECGIEATHDYWVPAGTDSLVVARHHLKENAGWGISPFEDLCSECAPLASKNQDSAPKS